MPSRFSKRRAHLQIMRSIQHTLHQVVDLVATGMISPSEAALSLPGSRVHLQRALLETKRRQREDDITKITAIKGVGRGTAERVIDELGSFESVKSASVSDLCRINGIKKKRAELIMRGMRQLTQGE